MSSTNQPPLPPYSEKSASRDNSSPNDQTTNNRVAGSVHTTSIRDFTVDYLKIVRESPTSYHVCLTVDPTPIYYIQIVTGSTKVGDIQMFHASDTTGPAIAAAQLSLAAKDKKDPIAMLCTSSPATPDAQWRPFHRASKMSVDGYGTTIPILTIPGMAPKNQQFSWRTNSLAEPYFQLLWDGPLSFAPKSRYMAGERGSEYVFATVARKTAEGGENVIEIRRGGGLDFELSVILELFVILQHSDKQLL